MSTVALERVERRDVATRTGWTIIDQGLSSLTNVVIVIAAAHAVSAADFGRFSIVLTVYSVSVGATRAVSGEPLLVAAGGGMQAGWTRATLGAAVVVSGVVALLVVAWNAAGPSDPLGWIFAAGVVLLLVQDATRFVLIASGRPMAAAINDAAWLCFAVAGLVAVNASRPAAHLAVWVVAGSLAAVVGLVQVAAVPDVVAGWRWIRDRLPLGRRFLAEFAFLSGASQIVVLVVGARSGATDAGSLRAAGTMLGPAGIVTNGLLMATVVEAGRHRGAAAVRSSVLAAAGVAAAAMVSCGLLIRAVPDGWGRTLLGDTWAGASGVAPWLSLSFAGTALATVVAAGMRGSGRTRESVRLVTALASGMIVAGLVGSRWGPSAAAGAMAVPAWIGGGVAVLRWRRTDHPVDLPIDGPTRDDSR